MLMYLCIWKLFFFNQDPIAVVYDLFETLFFSSFHAKLNTYLNPYFYPYFELNPEKPSVTGLPHSQP